MEFAQPENEQISMHTRTYTYRVFSSDFNSHLCTFFSSNFTILVFGNTIKVKFLSVLPAIVMFGILMAFALFLNNILDSISRQKKVFAVVL